MDLRSKHAEAKRANTKSDKCRDDPAEGTRWVMKAGEIVSVLLSHHSLFLSSLETQVGTERVSFTSFLTGRQRLSFRAAA